MNNPKENQTNYASIDKPWEKYFKQETYRNFNPEQKFVSMIEKANSENLNNYAINFMGMDGNRWTYDEIFKLSNKLASAYKKNGIGSGDHVLIITVCGLEEILNLLALDKIGAVSKWIDVTASEEEIEEAVTSDNCKMIVSFALAIERIDRIIRHTNVKKVLYVDPSQFIRIGKILTKNCKDLIRLLKIIQNGKKNKLPSKPSDELYENFNEFLQKGDENFQFCDQYEKEKPVLKIQSSGTTGKPKTIVHTDYSINCSIKKFAAVDLPLYPTNVLLKIAPAWVGYGLINSLAVGIAFGMEVLMTPMLADDMVLEYIQKFDITFAVPLHYRYIASHIDQVKSMKRPLALISGGDKISKNEIEDFSKLFSQKGCTAPILNGAGSNEILGAGCVNPLSNNRPGSIGIPMWGDVVRIFDPDTNEEKKIGESGEICYLTESSFKCYENDPVRTSEVKRIHSDGKEWIHTGDLGHQDKDGFIYIEGRMTRVIVVSGFKISANQIEEVIYEQSGVSECVVVGVPDDEYKEVPMAFITVNENADKDIKQKITLICQQKLKDKAVPKYIEILDEIPYTSNNKQNYKLLEKMGAQYVLECIHPSVKIS